MSRLQAFDRELSEHDSDGKDSWYDSGVLFVGQLEADLVAEDLIALGDLWPSRPAPWQKHCAEVLDRARHTETIVVLLGMVERGLPDIALAALESLREFDPALFTPEQRRRTLAFLKAMEAQPVGKLHHLVLGDFLKRMRDQEPEGN